MAGLEHSCALLGEKGGLDTIKEAIREAEEREAREELEEHYTLVLEHMAARGRRKAPHLEDRNRRRLVDLICVREDLRVFSASTDHAQKELQEALTGKQVRLLLMTSDDL